MFGRWKRRRPDPWELSSPVLQLNSHDALTLADCCEGTAIFGASGAGKTSGSGRTLAKAFLGLGMGGLVLTAKSEERHLFERYCRETGRLRDLRVISPRDPWRFNFLNYELHRTGEGAGLTENLVNLFSEVLELADGQSGKNGREEEGYWRRAMRQLCRNAVELLVQAQGTISIHDLYRLIVSLPQSAAQLESESWQKSSFCFQCLRKADTRPKSPLQQQDYELAADYCLLEFPHLSEKTRSVIVSTFTSMVDVLQRSLLRELLCTQTNLTPDVVQDGAVIVVDLPVKEYAQVGQVAQVIFKYCFMRAIERRAPQEQPRPVFLWADEAQNFTTNYDFHFQATARSSRVATVYLSQNLSNYYATLGAGEQGKARADSLLANLNTKIFHANGDPVTNEWAASLAGKNSRFLVNANQHYGGDDWLPEALGLTGPRNSSAGISETIDYDLQPSRFTTLRKGGPVNRWQVDGILFQGGRRFAATRKPWLPLTFNQND